MPRQISPPWTIYIHKHVLVIEILIPGSTLEEIWINPMPNGDIQVMAGTMKEAGFPPESLLNNQYCLRLTGIPNEFDKTSIRFAYIHGLLLMELDPIEKPEPQQFRNRITEYTDDHDEAESAGLN